VTWHAFSAVKKKAVCRARNRSEYNASLKRRGRLTMWVSSEAVANWTTDELTGQPGASPTYTDLAIEAVATAQAIYGLSGRQTQSFLQRVFELMKLDLPVPDHSTLSRRRRRLRINLPVMDWSKSLHLVVDSAGVRVYGEGEWKVRRRGVGKRQTWRKLHFCVDEATFEIVSAVASANDVSGAEALPGLLQDAPGEIE
jgi:Transposase DDE domain